MTAQEQDITNTLARVVKHMHEPTFEKICAKARLVARAFDYAYPEDMTAIIQAAIRQVQIWQQAKAA
jgi:hypothetical protein